MDKLLAKISIEDKTGIRILNSLFIMVLIYNYCFVFLGSFDKITEAIKPYKALESDFFNFLIFLFSYILILAFLSYEGLRNGNNRFSIAFNKDMPSKYIQDKFQTTEKIAVKVWLEHFNKLQNKKITISRGFACRFIYNILLSLIVFIILSLLTCIVEWFTNGTLINFETKIMLVFLSLALAIGVYFNNNPASDKPTGVWKSFQEINSIHIVYIDEHHDTIKNEIEQAQKNINA